MAILLYLLFIIAKKRYDLDSILHSILTVQNAYIRELYYQQLMFRSRMYYAMISSDSIDIQSIASEQSVEYNS